MTKKTTSSKNHLPKSKIVPRAFLMLAIFLVISGAAACRSAEIAESENAAAKNTNVASNAEKPDDSQERVRSVQTGNFEFVLVFRRPDKAVLSSDDKKFLKDNAPRDVNQWVLSADGKSVVAGSNYRFTPEQMDALKKRFTVEDDSAIAPEINGNANQIKK